MVVVVGDGCERWLWVMVVNDGLSMTMGSSEIIDGIKFVGGLVLNDTFF